MLSLLLLQLVAGIPFAVATGLTATVIAVINFGPQSLLIIASRIFDISDNYPLKATYILELSKYEDDEVSKMAHIMVFLAPRVMDE